MTMTESIYTGDRVSRPYALILALSRAAGEGTKMKEPFCDGNAS